MSDTGRAVLDSQLRAQKLSARSADRVLRLSWSVADLRAHDVPDADDVDIALALRRGSPLGQRAARPGGGVMTPKRKARLALSILCEPGDPRLPGLLAAHTPVELVEAISADRRLGADPWPSSWTHRAQSLDHRLAKAERLADAAGLRWVVPGDRGWPDGLQDLDHVEPLHGATGAPLGLWVRGTGTLADAERHQRRGGRSARLHAVRSRGRVGDRRRRGSRGCHGGERSGVRHRRERTSRCTGDGAADGRRPRL